MQQLQNQRVLGLCYEQVFYDPGEYLRASAGLYELDVSNQKLEALAVRINSERAYLYLDYLELQVFSFSCRVAFANRGCE